MKIGKLRGTERCFKEGVFGSSFLVKKIKRKDEQKMKKFKKLRNALLVLLGMEFIIAVFTFGYVRLGLSVTAFAIWSLCAGGMYLAPFIVHKCRLRKTKEMREHYEREEKRQNDGSGNDAPRVLLRHVNHRITNYLKSAYPESTWEWCIEDPEALVCKGGTGRIQVYGIADFSHADVTVNKNADISYEMLKIVPTGEDMAEGKNEETVTPSKSTVNPQVWYEQKGRVVLENIITDLNSRGHNSLSITESGDVIVKQAGREIRKATLEAMPRKIYWNGLAKVFQSEGISANVTDEAVILSW